MPLDIFIQIKMKLDKIVPVRTIGTSRRSMTGRVAIHGGEGSSFESSLERDWLQILDFNPKVLRIVEQPVRICYRDPFGARRQYTPDVLAEFDHPSGESRTVVYEVKEREELLNRWAELKPRFKAAVRFCRERSWRFKLMTECQIRTPYLANVRFLRSYRAIPADRVTTGQLLYTFAALGPTTPQALLAASYRNEENRMVAIPYLWRMLAHGEFATDLSKPLTMASKIWMHP